MVILSLNFFMFIAAACIIYYLIPHKFQWILLSGVSLLFIALCGGAPALGFILFASVITWGAAFWIERRETAYKRSVKGQELSREEKKARKKICQKKKKIVLLAGLLLTFGVLAYFKYINTYFHFTKILLPLGISFYTFQSVGYLLDVYWGKEQAEKNYLKYLLFVSFFPQIIQGPIGRYGALKKELYTLHCFDLERIEKAVILILWGVSKKFAIADRAKFVSNAVFSSPEKYGGVMTVVALFFYSMYMYADFSGGIDIVTGIAELFDVHLTENFKRPYFSASLAEFWRRWHISLGAWMRDYVFYPIAISDTMGKITKHIKNFPMVFCNLLVFFLVGIWHGAAGHYVVWGLYNGIIISVSAVAEPLYSRMKKGLHINGQEKWYKVFCILRTFMIVNIGWFFDGSKTLAGAFRMVRNVFGRPCHSQLTLRLMEELGLSGYNLIILALGVAVLLIISCIQEVKNCNVRDAVLRRPLWLRWLILYLFIFFTVASFAGIPEKAGGGFLYANF